MQKYYDTKGYKYRVGTKRLCASCAQNDVFEATQESQRAALRIEKVQAQSEEILMRSVLNLCDSLLSLFF